MATFASLVKAGKLAVGDGYRAKNDELGLAGPIFLRSAYLKESGWVLGANPDRIASLTIDRFGPKVARIHDTVLTTKGNSLGRLGLVDGRVAGAVYSPHLSYWRSLDHETIVPRFLYFWAQSAACRRQVQAMSYQTDMAPYLSLGDQLSLKIDLPEASRQHGIADLLAAFDDKIEANRRMNEALESNARALFKSWFVDFDPVRANAEDRAAGLSREVTALFPSALSNGALGSQPDGWRISNIGEEVSVIGGTTPSTASPEFWGGDYAWATPKDLSGLNEPVLLETERSLTVAGLAKVGSGLLPVDTVLLSSRAPIGYLAIAKLPTAINQGFVAMVCSRVVGPCFTYLWAGQNMDVIKSRANGSTFQEISKGSFRGIGLIVPPAPVADCFEQVVRPMFDRIALNARQSRTLAGLRDLLLPKLMSGAIRVQNAEQQLAEDL